MKKFTLLALSLMALALVLFNTGCTTATSTATTTTTSSVTTTTAAPVANTISGTITLPGLAGNLWVGAHTDSTFTATTEWQEVYQQVASSDASYNYSIPISTPGTYYVLAIVRVGTTEGTGNPVAGDRVGEYADGGLPVGFGKTPAGTPEAIIFTSGEAITGKDFELKVTW